MDISVIQYYGHQINKCGYCKGKNCSQSYGMHGFGLSAQNYQDLIDRGWRRSGLYCYKPNNEFTCCPCYTIRCDAFKFKLSKTHKKILRRMNRFLRDGKKDNTDLDVRVGDERLDADSISEEPKAPNVILPNINLAAVTEKNFPIPTEIQKKKEKSVVFGTTVAATSKESAASKDNVLNKSIEFEKPPCKKAKQIRLERRQAKLAAKGLITEDLITPKLGNREKTLTDYINETSPTDKYKLKLVLLHADSEEFKNSLKTTYELYKKYQTHIHNDPPNNVRNFLEFLQESPLKHSSPVDGPPSGYGSFHQQYWLNDKLIAVGVIDLLPYCVSSVYFFYDPDYSFLSLGTYASLREIEFVQQLSQHVSSLKYYYMGFYIHSCPKMRYKGKLSPSYLLCPESYKWCLLTKEIQDKLDEYKYQRLNTNLSDEDPEKFEITHLDKVLLLNRNHKFCTYGEYIQSFKIKTIDNMLDIIRSRIYKEVTGDNDDRDVIIEYGKLVGLTCAHRLFYYKD